MPENWRDLARTNRTAAHELLADRRWRSGTSRAYYAAYSEVTHALLTAGVPMPAGQNNPKHNAVPAMVANSLGLIGVADRLRLSGVIANLYKLRIVADYLPASTVGDAEARVALGLMTQVFVWLKAVP